jgi:hypothetical protein
MFLRRAVLFVATLFALLGSRAEAHFLWIRILPPDEGGRAAEVYFSDSADIGDPQFIEKIAGSTLWIQKSPGKFEPLKVHKSSDRLRAWLPGSGSIAVGGVCTYGVIARTNQTPFLLRHFPKALSGNPDELNKLQSNPASPLEIAVAFEGDHVNLLALKNGKPLPKVDFVTIDAGLKNTTVAADENGKATWKPAANGVYSVYFRDTTKEAGDLDGKKYAEIRSFATVAFAWPPDRKDADPAAVALFEEALATRAQWHDFPGFTAQITGNMDGRHFAGKVTIDARGQASYTDDDIAAKSEAAAEWVNSSLGSLAMHRIARPARPGAPKPVLRFAEGSADHPLGKLLIFDGGSFASSYRVKDKQLTVVNRLLGKENMTITTLDNEHNAEGRFLPRNYVVQYWEAGTGRLVRTETIQDRWQRVGSWDLPTTHTVTAATETGLSARTFTLTKHEVMAAKGK